MKNMLTDNSTNDTNLVEFQDLDLSVTSSIVENKSIKEEDNDEESLSLFANDSSMNMPLITSADDEGEVTEGSVLSDEGTIEFRDMKIVSESTVSESLKSISAIAQDGESDLPLTSEQQDSLSAAFSLSNIEENGMMSSKVDWDYSVAETTVDFLGEGEVVTATFTVTVENRFGMSDSEDVTITITGTNDAPVITSADSIATIVETDVLSDSGSILFEDVDLTDRPTTSESTKSVTALLRDGESELTLTEEQQTDIEAAFNIKALDTNTNNGEIIWDYTITESKLDFLAQGEQVTAVFTVTVTDDEGATAEQDVTVTLTGTNDRPIISDVTVEDTLLETNGLETIYEGQLALTEDVDVTDTHTFQQVGEVSVVTDSEVEVTDLSVVVNEDGTYSVDGNFDHLAEGETATVTFRYTATDDSGADNAVSEEKTVTLTVTGTNDQPIVEDVEIEGTRSNFVFGSQTVVSDELSVSDLDTTDTHTFQQVGEATVTTSGFGRVMDLEINVSENGEYTVDGNFSLLMPDETATIEFDYMATDDSGADNDNSEIQTVTVTVTGTNDQPEILNVVSTAETPDLLGILEMTNGIEEGSNEYVSHTLDEVVFNGGDHILSTIEMDDVIAIVDEESTLEIISEDTSNTDVNHITLDTDILNQKDTIDSGYTTYTSSADEAVTLLIDNDLMNN